MRTFLAISAALMVTACAPSLEAFNERGGVIRHTQLGTNMAGVTAMADRYCSIYGRKAVITGRDLVWSDTVTFDCVQ